MTKGDAKALGLHVAVCAADRLYLERLSCCLLELKDVDQCVAYRDGGRLLDDLAAYRYYDAIIVDEAMRDTSVLCFLLRLQELPLLELPCVIVTGASGCIRALRVKAGHLMDEYLYKPYSFLMLESRLVMLCRARKDQVPGGIALWLREWGVLQNTTNAMYLAEMLRVCGRQQGSPALRKDVLLPVAEKYGVTLSAVDSGLRRLIDQAESCSTPAYLRFKACSGLEGSRPSVKQLMSACRQYRAIQALMEEQKDV